MSIDEATPHSCSPRETRRILRSLRDLNLVGTRLEVRAGEAVSIHGCVSMDSPVEQGVRYKLRMSGGEDAVLRIRADENQLRLSLDGEDVETRELVTRLECRNGAIAECPELSARLEFEELKPRDLEHFLRRIVRGLLAA